MERKRYVVRQLAVLDLPESVKALIPGTAPGRILFLFDRQARLRRFQVLSRGITHLQREQIAEWLEANLPQHPNGDACKEFE